MKETWDGIELCFSYIPLARLRARMIRNNWQVLRHEKEKALTN